MMMCLHKYQIVCPCSGGNNICVNARRSMAPGLVLQCATHQARRVLMTRHGSHSLGPCLHHNQNTEARMAYVVSRSVGRPWPHRLCQVKTNRSAAPNDRFVFRPFLPVFLQCHDDNDLATCYGWRASKVTQ
mmetsp:Transcript_598/g.1004  ORF Transcript_598/g.1004 Transcript_598/m.1004 type:complete len:131 (-) Transcript_598:586-978(-)